MPKERKCECSRCDHCRKLDWQFRRRYNGDNTLVEQQGKEESGPDKGLHATYVESLNSRATEIRRRKFITKLLSKAKGRAKCLHP